MKRYILILLCLTVLSCGRQFDELQIVSLGCAQTEVSVGHLAGEVAFDIVSDGDFTAETSDEWLHLDGGESLLTFSGDCSLKVSYDPNRSIDREGTVVLKRGTRQVQLVIVQKGVLSDDFAIEIRNHNVAAEGGTLSTKVTTITPQEEISFDVEYVETEHIGWIDSVRLENNYLRFRVLPNRFDGLVRHAVITMTKQKGMAYGKVQVRQTSPGFEYDACLTAEQLKQMYSMSSDTIDSHLLLTGVVLNDNREGNGAENHNVSVLIQDLDAADRTLYISDEEGRHGVRLDFVKGSQLLTRRFDRIQIDLMGAVLTRYSDPERYVVSGLDATAVISNETGPDLIPEKIAVGDLTDDDVYTLKTLKDCEIPIRKGPYVPYEMTNLHLADKYPMVIRDINGDDMHMVVNTTCKWQRDGEGMPEGSGSITGVIVHEHCDQFEWDPVQADAVVASQKILPDYVNDIGDIGRYQIRPIQKSDICLAKDFKDGFSEMICEFRYFNKSYNELFKTADSVYLYSTYPPLADPALADSVNGRMSVRSILKDTTYTISAKRDWTLLGPVSEGRITDPTTGNGVNYYQGESAVWKLGSAYETTGLVEAVNGSAWHDQAWTTKKFWMIEFSTEGIEQHVHKHMSVQFGTVNSYGDRLGAPRYWKLEYSLDGKDWLPVSEYTVPDFPMQANKRHWQCPGHKYMTFSLDDCDVWNKEKVYIRMLPASKKCGSQDSYDAGVVDGTTGNSLNYFAIRYNK